MTSWENYIIHLCMAANEIRQYQRERENKYDIGKINSFMNNTMKWIWQKPSELCSQ